MLKCATFVHVSRFFEVQPELSVCDNFSDVGRGHSRRKVTISSTPRCEESVAHGSG